MDCDDEKATLIMLDTNLNNREKILPVEKGYAYKQRNNIIKNRQKGSNINEFNDNSTEWNEEGKSQIYNYIRLTELIKLFYFNFFVFYNFEYNFITNIIFL